MQTLIKYYLDYPFGSQATSLDVDKQFRETFKFFVKQFKGICARTGFEAQFTLISPREESTEKSDSWSSSGLEGVIPFTFGVKQEFVERAQLLYASLMHTMAFYDMRIEEVGLGRPLARMLTQAPFPDRTKTLGDAIIAATEAGKRSSERKERKTRHKAKGKGRAADSESDDEDADISPPPPPQWYIDDTDRSCTGVIRSQRHDGKELVTHSCYLQLPPECFIPNPQIDPKDVLEYESELAYRINDALRDMLKAHNVDWKPKERGVRISDLLPVLIDKKLCIVNYPHAVPMPNDPFPTPPGAKHKGHTAAMKAYEQDLLYTVFYSLDRIRIVPAIYLAPDQRKNLLPPREEEVQRWGAKRFTTRPDFWIILTDVITHLNKGEDLETYGWLHGSRRGTANNWQSCGGSFYNHIRGERLCPTSRVGTKRKRPSEDDEDDDEDDDEEKPAKDKLEPDVSIDPAPRKKQKRAPTAAPADVAPTKKRVATDVVLAKQRISSGTVNPEAKSEAKRRDRLNTTQHEWTVPPLARDPPLLKAWKDVNTGESEDSDDDRPLVVPSRATPRGPIVHEDDQASQNADGAGMQLVEMRVPYISKPELEHAQDQQSDVEMGDQDEHAQDIDMQEDDGPQSESERRDDEPEFEEFKQHDDEVEQRDEFESGRRDNEFESEQGDNLSEYEGRDAQSESEGSDEEPQFNQHDHTSDGQRLYRPDAHSPEWDTTNWDMADGSDREGDEDHDIAPTSPPNPALLGYLVIELDPAYQKPGEFYGVWFGCELDQDHVKLVIQRALANLRRLQPCAITWARQIYRWQQSWPSELMGYEQAPIAMETLFLFAHDAMRLAGELKQAKSPDPPSGSPGSPAKATRGAKARKRVTAPDSPSAAPSMSSTTAGPSKKRTKAAAAPAPLPSTSSTAIGKSKKKATKGGKKQTTLWNTEPPSRLRI
ncbi:hypothetical protein BKA62DRAFT_679679 [Auriculariales sp. MPI-PUGE-AT-0066]|nr:hypothetical protein BKA62DRAFT_679679 [Auriculariales sp. MPI-PUGE-AT-0066]